MRAAIAYGEIGNGLRNPALKTAHWSEQKPYVPA